MNFRFLSGGTWGIQRVNPPWGERPSIYQHILSHSRPGEPGLGEEGDLLPDDDRNLWTADLILVAVNRFSRLH
jgi:hypothetical protein